MCSRWQWQLTAWVYTQFSFAMLEQSTLRPRVTDTPLSEAGTFAEPSYLVLTKFSSLFSCILLVQSEYCALCQWSRHGQFLAQRPVVLKRKLQVECPSRECSTLSLELTSAARSNYVSHQWKLKLFKCYVLYIFDMTEGYLSMKNKIPMYLRT